MLFKLVMPSLDRLMAGGVVSKWHKAEGEHVDYGDDLVDVNFELKMSGIAGSVEETIRFVKDDRTFRDKVRGNVMVDRAMLLVARITSSDMGVLRRIEAREGSYGAVGSLLAVLATEDDASSDRRDEDLQGAVEFRVVANLVE